LVKLWATVRCLVFASRQLGVNNLLRVVTQPRPGRGSNSRPVDRKSDALPLRHHATSERLFMLAAFIAECVMHRSAVCPSVRLSVTTLTHPAYVFVPLSGSRYTPYRIVAMGAGTCLYANIYVYTEYKQRYNMIHVIIGETRLFPCCIRPRNCSLLLAVNIT